MRSNLSTADVWGRAARQAGRDARLWLALMVLFTLYRGGLLWWFRAGLEPGWGAREVALGCGRGFFYDVIAATLLVLPSLSTGVLLAVWRRERWAAGFRRCWVWGVVTVSVTLALLNGGFFREYHEQFNQWVFGLIYDDRAAILKTVWRDYPVLWLGLCWAVAVGVIGAGLARFTARTGGLVARLAGARARWWRAALTLALAVAVVFGARGSLGRRPMQRKDAAVTRSRLINALVPNFYLALKYAIADHRRQSDPRRLPDWLRDGGIRGALTVLYGERARTAPDLDALLARTADGQRRGPAPRHIFLIVLESGDLWPLLPPYAELGLMNETRRLADRGWFFSRVVSAGAGTMPSLAAIITGLPHTGAAQNYQPLSRRPFPTSLATTFKRLGYRTRLYYGGLLSWQRLGAFAVEQGFDEVRGGGDLAGADDALGEWGVPDGVLFDDLAARTGDAPTFTLVLTTSYHPPYSLDVARLGVAIDAVPAALSGAYDGRVPLREFAHLRYADRELGRFVAQVERAYPDSLFAITGDHWSRRFLNQHPSLYESRAVPLVLYGPLTLGGAGGERLTPGSHLDIAPTLVNLVAERGFTYHTFGHDLLSPAAPPFALGADVLFTADEVVLFPAGADAEQARFGRAWLGAAWWRLLRGGGIDD